MVVVGELSVRKREAGGGVEGDGGRWWDEVDKVVVGGELCVRKHEAGGGAGAKSDETERDGSVSGAPCEMAVEGDGGRCWDEVDQVVTAARCYIRQHEGGGTGWAKNPKPSRSGSVSGCIWAAEGREGAVVLQLTLLC